jgi:hypothetical protein
MLFSKWFFIAPLVSFFVDFNDFSILRREWVGVIWGAQKSSKGRAWDHLLHFSSIVKDFQTEESELLKDAIFYFKNVPLCS